MRRLEQINAIGYPNQNNALIITLIHTVCMKTIKWVILTCLANSTEYS